MRVSSRLVPSSSLTANGTESRTQPGRVAVPVVIEDERPRSAAPVGVRVDVLVDPAAVGRQVVQRELVGLGEVPAPAQQRHDLALVARDQPLVRALVQRGAPELHAVLLGEALELPVAEHRQAGQRREERRDAEVLVALPELLDRGLLVRVVHEVHVALEDLRIELQGVPQDPPVLVVVLVAEHVHERAVVDAVHAERPHEVALEHPERLGQEQGVRHLRGDPVHDLAPELLGHGGVELRRGHRAVLGTRRDGLATLARGREPQPSDVAPGQHHRGVEADDREAAGDREDRLDHLLPDGRLAEVQLRGVVPGEARAVVAVVDVAALARRRGRGARRRRRRPCCPSSGPRGGSRRRRARPGSRR